MQTMGFVRASLYAYDMINIGGTDWGLYHGPIQPYGRGDGSDGKSNNLLCLATPGQSHSKASTVNQDLQNVSVRGAAFLNWMQAAAPSKNTPKKLVFRRRP